MNSISKKMLFLVLLFLTMTLGGCGDDDKVVMITTEDTRDITSEESENENTISEDEYVTEAKDTSSEDNQEQNREEATDEEKKLTIEEIYQANLGDKLLSDCTGYSVNTIYYSNGSEVYSEFKYLGFDENGIYMQAYEDSDGRVEILDNYNGYYYLVGDNQVSTLIYPEDGVLGIMINYNHNNLIIEQPSEEVSETVKDVYREDGVLVVETDYITELDDKYTYKYYLDDDYKIRELFCYIEDMLVIYSRTTKDAVYNEPELITDLKADTDTRLITIKYPNKDGFDMVYQVPADYPVNLGLFEYSAYLDEACTEKWVMDYSVLPGDFTDEIIYLKK